MNWKLIFQLSLFGLAMGIATVFWISSNIEPVVWLLIFVICAYVFAKRLAGGYFLHGLLLGIANSLWVTASHVLLYDRYIATHARDAAMMTAMPLPGAPRLMMAIVGPGIGVVSGLVLGLLAVIAHKVVGPRTPSSVAPPNTAL